MSKVIDIVVSAKNRTKGVFSKVASSAKSMGSKIGKSFSAIAGGAKAAVAIIAAVGTAIVAVGAKAAKAWIKQARANAKLEAVLKATGYAAGFTSVELRKQAEALSEQTGIADESIVSMQGLLASFKNIKGDQFTEASGAILDMSAAMSKAGSSTADVEAQVVQVGKALNDPIKGISALSRVGVTFTEQQKEQIKVLQESGDMAGAQAVILKELQSEFGGTAKAMGDASGGLDKMKNTFGDAMERIGETIVTSSTFKNIVAKITEVIKNLTESGRLELWARKVGKVFKFAGKIIKGYIAYMRVVRDIQRGILKFFVSLAKGDSLSEAFEKAKNVRADREAAQEKELALIRKARAEKEAAQQAEEEAAKKQADIKRQQLEAEAKIAAEKQKQIELEKQAAEEAKKQAAEKKKQLELEKQAAKEAEEAAKKRVETQQKLAGVQRTFREMSTDDEIKAFERNANLADKEIEKANREIEGIAFNKEDRRKKRREEYSKRQDDRREATIRDKLARGVTIGNDDKAFLKLRDLQAKIKGEQQAKEIAIANARARAERKEEERHKRTLDELEKTRKMLEKNLEAV